MCFAKVNFQKQLQIFLDKKDLNDPYMDMFFFGSPLFATFFDAELEVL